MSRGFPVSLRKQILIIIISCQIQELLRLCQENMSEQGAQAANDAQASTGIRDDDSTTSSTSQPNKTTRFYKRLSAWLTLYDQKAY